MEGFTAQSRRALGVFLLIGDWSLMLTGGVLMEQHEAAAGRRGCGPCDIMMKSYVVLYIGGVSEL